MSVEAIEKGAVCRSELGILGIVIGSIGNVHFGIRLSDGGQWQTVDPTYVCAGRDLLVPAAAAVRAACPRDTDGDGDCGRLFCPHCGRRAPSRIGPTLAAVRAEWEEHPDLRLGQLIGNVASNLNTDPYALEDTLLRANLEAKHPPRNLPA